MVLQNVKLIVFVPESHADVVRKALGNAGAGKIENYSYCSFSAKGVGRFVPGEGSNPAIGNIGKLEEVVEERIEVVCERDLLPKIINALKEAHPYEEPVFDVYPLESIE